MFVPNPSIAQAWRHVQSLEWGQNEMYLSISLVVALAVVCMVVLDEDSLIAEVYAEGDSCNAETREGVLEAVPSREGASVSPGLAAPPQLVSYRHGRESISLSDVALTVSSTDRLQVCRRQRRTS